MLPSLARRTVGGIALHTDAVLAERHGIQVAFTERTGGVSLAPFASLDLAAHVGDDPVAVDENRRRALDALGLGALRHRLTCAEQVHGCATHEVGAGEAGAGAYAGSLPVAGADALLTLLPDTPLLLCFADCVPVVLVATAPRRGVAVVHAGWRGTLARIPASAAAMLAERTGADPSSLLAYIGPHICGRCYQVGDELLWRFEEEFGTMQAPRGRLDLGAVVSGCLLDCGIREEHLVAMPACTAEETKRFFSYRAEGVTGRHGAIAAILEGRG